MTLSGQERLVTRVMGQVDLEDISRDGRVLVGHPNFRFDMIARPPGESRERELAWLGLSVVADLSRDGSRVLFTEYPEGAGEGAAAYLRGTDGSPAVRLGDGLAQALSPDGNWALVILESPPRLAILPTGAGQTTDLTRPGLTYVSGTWFPDSRRVLLMADAGGKPRLYSQDLDGGEAHPIGPENVVGGVAAPDGRAVLAVLRDGKAVIQPVDAGESRPVAGFGDGDQPLSWGSDGRSLYVKRLRGLATQVSRLDPVTGRRELVAELAAPDPAGVANPAPMVAVSADGKSYAYSFMRNLSELYLIEGLK